MKDKEKGSTKSKKMPAIEHRRVLTAEGWKRILKAYQLETSKRK